MPRRNTQVEYRSWEEWLESEELPAALDGEYLGEEAPDRLISEKAVLESIRKVCRNGPVFMLHREAGAFLEAFELSMSCGTNQEGEVALQKRWKKK